MMPLRCLQMGVFADRPGAGNALGAVLDGELFEPSRMQAFAAWTNLSETIFLLPPTVADADYRVRIFTPCQQLPFAGHPSVGAAWAAIEAGYVGGANSAATAGSGSTWMRKGTCGLAATCSRSSG